MSAEAERLAYFMEDRACYGFTYGGVGDSREWDDLMKLRAKETAAALRALPAPPAAPSDEVEAVALRLAPIVWDIWPDKGLGVENGAAYHAAVQRLARAKGETA